MADLDLGYLTADGLASESAALHLDVGLTATAAGLAMAIGARLVSPEYLVRLWDGPRLVAEGSRRTASGAVTLQEANGSGLSATLSLAYSAELPWGEGWLDLKWPKSYKVFYGTANPCDFSGAPQATVSDSGGTDFSHQSASLSPGDYYYGIQDIDDEGDADPSPATFGPLTVRAIPAAPTIVSITQTTPYQLVVTFTADEGTDNKIFFGNPNEPVNFDELSDGPASVWATSPQAITIPAYTTTDHAADFSTLEATFDSAMSALNAAYGNGEGTYAPGMAAALSALTAAVGTYQAAIGLDMSAELAGLEAVASQTADSIASLPEGLDIVDWTAMSQPYYARWLEYVGTCLEDEPNRYLLPDGSPPSAAQTGQTGGSLWDRGQPFTRPNYVTIVLRSYASGTGTPEYSNTAATVRLDASGNLAGDPPAQPSIVSASLGFRPAAYNPSTLLTAPEAFDNAAWLKTYVTVTPNATTDPTGGSGADQLASTNAFADILQSVAGTSQRYTATVYLKAGTATSCTLRLYAGPTSPYVISAQILSGPGSVTLATNGSGNEARVTGLSSTWTRLAITSDADILYATVGLQIALPTVGAYLYSWGAELYAGTLATERALTVRGGVLHDGYEEAQTIEAAITPEGGSPATVTASLPGAVANYAEATLPGVAVTLGWYRIDLRAKTATTYGQSRTAWVSVSADTPDGPTDLSAEVKR
ncbi:MAG TPA: hypothetical protein VGP72_10520 [Planctomycetota bacterium]|jgi:hypothetical protein